MRTVMLRTLLVCVMLAGVGIGTTAQGAPEPINDALAAFNQRIGKTLTLNDFFWTWEQQTFPDSTLGCVVDGITPFQTSISGYRFLFTYLEQTYEYRVSADRASTVFCGIVGDDDDDLGPDVAGDIDDRVQLSNSLCPAPPADTIYPRSRVAPETEARVIASSANLLPEPNTTSAPIASIPGGATVRVLSGTNCDPQSNILVQVEYNGQVGYVAEAVSGVYALQPLPPAAEIPASRARITMANAASLREAAKLQGNFGEGLAWSQSDKLAVTGGRGAEGVWVYQPIALASIEPRIIRSRDRFNIAQFSTVSTQRDTLLLGAVDGGVHIWDLNPSSNLIERLVLNGHNAAVTAIAFSPDGRRVASSGGYAFATTEDALNQNAILVWDINNITQVFVLRGHEDEVLAVAFSPDNTTIASASLDGSVRLWDASNGTQTARIDAGVPATALAFAPDGTTLAVGYRDGATVALSLVGGLSAGPVVPTHSAPVSTLMFSPDGGLLVSGAQDGSLGMRAGDSLLTAETPIVRQNVHNGAVTAVAMSPDGTTIASLGLDRTVRLLVVP